MKFILLILVILLAGCVQTPESILRQEDDHRYREQRAEVFAEYKAWCNSQGGYAVILRGQKYSRIDEIRNIPGPDDTVYCKYRKL